MGKLYFDFGSPLKKKDKKKDKKDDLIQSVLDDFASMNIKKWSNKVTLSDRPRDQIPATQQMMSSNFSMQQSIGASNAQAAKAAQTLQSQVTMAQIDAQTKMIQQMMHSPIMKAPPEYAPIQDCHCKGGCWDCDDRKVMAIPTIEWVKNS